NKTIRTRSTWSIGRIVDWKYGLYENKRAYPAFCDQNAHLWFDAFGDLAGFCISENGDTGFAILTLAGCRFLYEDMLQWVLQNWASRGASLSTEITEHQALEAAILEQHGLQSKSSFFARRFDLTGALVPRFPLEPGFSIVDMHTHPDYRAQRILRAEAFQGKSEISEAELQEHLRFYNHIHNGPIYHPQADLCVMAPDGCFVSGCEALIDTRNAEADIERVCTHSAFRKRGFARAVIQECLYRLREMGMRSAYITGYSPEAIALYGSLGAVDEVKAYVYESKLVAIT
ncbi:MAG: GNAT family N-acetyltransferase, partial [Anaerolineaceae bacterium]|nr:GNAT family N-acetyltransferase [Anaerolineaceae bacterium]